jgi:hypothetical protein
MLDKAFAFCKLFYFSKPTSYRIKKSYVHHRFDVRIELRRF